MTYDFFLLPAASLVLHVDLERILPASGGRLKTYHDLLVDFGEFGSLQRGELLESSPFASVYSCRSLRDNNHYALKVQQTDDWGVNEKTMQELRKLAGFPQHKNVLSVSDFYAFTRNQSNERPIYYIVIARALTGRRLEVVIRARAQNEGEVLLYRSRANFKRLCTDLVQALVFYSRCLRHRKISHSDINSQAILLQDKQFLLANLGYEEVSLPHPLTQFRRCEEIINRR